MTTTKTEEEIKIKIEEEIKLYDQLMPEWSDYRKNLHESLNPVPILFYNCRGGGSTNSSLPHPIPPKTRLNEYISIIQKEKIKNINFLQEQNYKYKISRNNIEDRQTIALLPYIWRQQLRYAPIFYINIVIKAFCLNILHNLEPNMINNGTLENEYKKFIKLLSCIMPIKNSFLHPHIITQDPFFKYTLPPIYIQLDIYQDGMTLEQMEKIWLIDTEIASTVLDDNVPLYYKKIFLEPNIEIQECIQIINKANELRLLKFIDISSLYYTRERHVILNKLKCIWRETIYKYMYKDLHNFVSNPSHIRIFEHERLDTQFDITQYDPIFDGEREITGGAGCGSSRVTNVLEQKMKTQKKIYAYPALASRYNKHPNTLDTLDALDDDEFDTLLASVSTVTPYKTSKDSQPYYRRNVAMHGQGTSAESSSQYMLANDIAAFGKH